MAKNVHRHSTRRRGPFIGINCGVFNEQLLANELFGHEKGAFTGAVAQGDTIELAHLPPALTQSGAIRSPCAAGRLPTLEEQEQAYIRHVLKEVNGNQTAAAKILGINRAALWRKLRAWQAESDA